VNIDLFIKECSSFSDFFSKSKLTSEKEKGKLFERLSQLHLQSHPKYSSQLVNVWMLSEVPSKIKAYLTLPNADEGIDLIAKTIEGKFWAIQSKYRSNINSTLKWNEKNGLSSFTSLAFNVCSNITFGLVLATVTKPLKKIHLTPNVGFELFYDFQSLDQNNFEGWKNLISYLDTDPTPPKPYKPRKHQERVLKKAQEYFLNNENTRGKILMPCGTGKSLVGVWLTLDLKPKEIIIAVPSLNLIKQTLNVWTREFLANNISSKWICVCSDSAAGKVDIDSYTANTYDLGIPCVTDQSAISNFLSEPLQRDQIRVIFTTYQSSKTLSEAARSVNHSFDLCIMDEAHKTVGHKEGIFAHLLHETNIKINKRIFMTATERYYRGASDQIATMNDFNLYGHTIDLITFKEAIDKYKIICDYKFITYAISESEIKQYWDKNSYIDLQDTELDVDTTRALVSSIAIEKAYTSLGIKRAISFHNSIKKAERFMSQQKKLFTESNIEVFHVSSKIPVGKRTEQLVDFERAERGLITNARCLTEGVDIPSVDSILFTEPRRSKVDIVQAAGRAMRLSPETGKKFGYIIVPIIVPDGVNFKEFADSTEFSQIITTITALASEDERIVEHLRTISSAKPSFSKNNNIIDLQLSEVLYKKISYDDLKESLELKVWKKVSKFNFREYEDAREYVNNLNLKSIDEWRQLLKSGTLPFDIPRSPEFVYKEKGWVNYYDWLGKERPDFLPYDEAEAYMHNLGFVSQKEWNKWASSEERPYFIPHAADRVYKDKGWISWRDWLGYKEQYSRFLPFDEARSYARSLNLTSQKDWLKNKKNLPINIPKRPKQVYKNKGWIDWYDWLGYSGYLSFDELSSHAQSLGIKSQAEWNKYANSDQFPENIPKAPWMVYEDWIGFGSFLGTYENDPITHQKKFDTYEAAKKVAIDLNIKSVKEWYAASKAGLLPVNVPSAPNEIYKDKGWTGWSDFLSNRQYLPFEEARSYARSLNLSSSRKWEKLTNLPDNIPKSAGKVYKNKGWIGWQDFLGCGFLSYEEAKIFIHPLGFKNSFDWHNKSDLIKTLPKNIPRDPSRTYKRSGEWVSWADWCGSNGALF
jgi:superfamily II DNA or RNA helicase